LTRPFAGRGYAAADVEELPYPGLRAGDVAENHRHEGAVALDGQSALLLSFNCFFRMWC